MQIITKLINSTKTRNVPETFAITRNIWERVKYQVSSDSWTMLQNFYTFNTIRQIPWSCWFRLWGSKESIRLLSWPVSIVSSSKVQTFPHCAFSNVSSNCLPERMHTRTGCICLAFLHCAFSNVASNHLLGKMQSHNGCICLTFLHCAFSNVSSERLHNFQMVHLERKCHQNHCYCTIALDSLTPLNSKMFQLSSSLTVYTLKLNHSM